MRPYYADDHVTLYHARWEDVPPDLLRADVLVTDPPYGIDLDTRRKSRKSRGAVIGDDRPFDPAPLLALGIPAVLWGANHYASRLPDRRGWLAWVKVIFDGAYGTRQMNKKQAEVEFAWTDCVARPKSFRHLWDGAFRDSEHGEHHHPTQKPVVVMRWVLGLVPDGVVLDPYSGGGSTLVAAKSMGRRAVGVEVDERHCETTAKRLSQEVLGLAA